MKLPPVSLRRAALLLALFASGASGFGQSAVTDPVGFITVNVAAGSATSPALSLVSPTLLQTVSWEGVIATISGTTITVSGSPWTAGQFGANGQYFVEVVSGTSAGAWTDIESTTTGSLTTLDDLSAFAGTNSTIRIRKHTTLGDFLGVNNSAGLKGGTELALADEVAVYDGSNSVTYWYYDGTDGGTPGWLDSSFHSAASVVIAPDQGVIIRHKASAVSFVSMGTVKTGNTFFPIRVGLNVVGTVVAKGLTLATSGLNTDNATTGVKGGKEIALADEVTIFSGGGSATYWYYDGTDGGTPGWLDTGFLSASAVAIPPGSSIIIKRKAGVAFNWSVPSPTSF